MIEINKIYNEDCLEGMKLLPENSIDLTVTSPPYDNLRTYNGYSFDFEGIARESFRVTKQGGVVVWIVADATVKGSETGTSFRQALYFKEIGFNLFDTMIWNKESSGGIGSLSRYENVFEYMFIISKGKPKTTNIIMDKPNKHAGTIQKGSIRESDGSVRKTTGYGKRNIKDFGRRWNVWHIMPAKSKSERLHPAPFSEQLANDHIISWSNPGDIVLDPFMGSGTTAKMAIKLNRKYIGFEISSEYCELARNRLFDMEED